jgi:hypothetical protein
MNRYSALSIVVVLQILILAGQWFGGSTRVAQAQIADPGAQRAEIIDQLKQANAKLDKLTEVLQSGKLQVSVAKPD